MHWFSHPKYRKILFQVLTILTVVGIVAFFTHNVTQNLARAGQNIDFGFLSDRSGFSIDQTFIAYDHDDSIAKVLAVGLLNTLFVSLLAGLAATLLGVFFGSLRLSKNWLVAKIIATYVDVFRNIPLLLQIFFWYFAVLSVLPRPKETTLTLGCADNAGCLATLSNRGLNLASPHWGVLLQNTLYLGLCALIIIVILHIANQYRQRLRGEKLPFMWLFNLSLITMLTAYYFINLQPQDYEMPVLKGFNYRGGITILPELVALWLSLTLYSAAYIAEYVRAGIQSVDQGQSEAAASLGLPQSQIMRLVVLPQALRVIIPPLTNQYLNVVKNSSLATAIAYPDLFSVFTGTALNQTGRAVEIIAITMAIYLGISLLISLGMNIYNRHKALKER